MGEAMSTEQQLCLHPNSGRRKKTYRSEAKARKAQRLAQGGRSHLAGLTFYVYACRWCGGWHLTTTPKC
jgi:hypothetical protein